MRKAPLYLGAFASAAAFALLALALLGGNGLISPAQAVPGQVTQVAIDMDTTGNDDSTVGTIENCKQLASIGDQWTFDLVVQGVDPADRIRGYQVDIDYDPSVIKIVSAVDVDAAGSNAPDDVTMISRIFSVSGAGFLSTTELTPDTDGSFTVAALDGTALNIGAGTGFPEMHEPASTTNAKDDDGDTVVDNAEEGSGDGVLARITVEAVGNGLSSLIIPGPAGGADKVPDLIIQDANNNEVPVQTVAAASISVGQPCVHQAGPVVLISALDCNGSPEVVGIKNVGTGPQDLTGWTLKSDGGAETLDLSTIPNLSQLFPGTELSIFSGPSAPQNPTLPEFSSGTTAWFRDADTSDFAAVFNGATQVDKESCTAGEMRENNVGGFSITFDEDNVGTCNDGQDNGGGDGADASDVNDCKKFDTSLEEDPAAPPGSVTCANGLDDDGDTLIDKDDPDCLSFDPTLKEDGVGTCGDGVNNDPALDSDADNLDTDCLGKLSTGGDGVIADDPVETLVATPNGGTLRIVEEAITQSPPTGLTLVGQEVSITAPAASANQPLIIEFLLDSSLIFAGEDETTLRIFKDGTEVSNCTSSTSASPDPCIAKREALATGDVKIRVLTSGASLWTFGLPTPAATPTPAAGATSTPTPGAGGAGALPPTGDGIPVDEGGSSVLAWALIGLGAAIALSATGYFAYGRTRGNVGR